MRRFAQRLKLERVDTAKRPRILKQLSTRCALALLGAMVFASVVGMLALGPVTAIADEHRLTDSRTPLGLTNGWSVLLQLPFASAEFIDWADLPIWAASGGVISGHALHHLV